ncbi:MAG TPA: EAL domain-containing protein [Sphingomicrobium sp.]|jgi:diguanylate cyclase (GGDEF)-like protein|nr:EAL domain-containing protein [Sphingomicrobium sp.]
MAKSVTNRGDSSYQMATSHLITTCATLAALILFVLVGAKVLPSAMGLTKAGQPAMVVAFLLNIAIILFGYRRANDLNQTLSALKAAEQEALDNAYTDHTTGLGNRRTILRELERAFREGGAKGALIILDLDHFKKVNDLYGHSTGDQLLQFTAETIQKELPQKSVAARLGGDEFAAYVADSGTVEDVARRIIAALSAPISLGPVKTQISASAGLARLERGLDADEILRRADVAMYSVKRSGRNGLAWFDEEMSRQLQNRVALEEEIRAAIEADEFVPFFQPLISLESGELNGFEVLARWRSPTRGVVEPADFIEIAEQSGQIGALSMRVMEKALLEAKEWPSELKLAVNVSPIQFRDPRLAERIIKMLTETGFPARRLEVEITESSLLEDREQALTIVQSLRNNGITIALDDFGTGYASLSQLQSLPFDRIKIDRSFINALGQDEQSAAIVETITALGRSLHVPITAEGVETPAIREKLASLGCSDAQGWYFGRAVAGHVASMQFARPAELPPETVNHEKRDPRASGSKW